MASGLAKKMVCRVILAVLMSASFVFNSETLHAQFMQGNVHGLERDLKRHVEFMAADSLQGRAAGSKGELSVARYIYDELERAGLILLSPRDGEDFYMAGNPAGASADTLHSRNVLALVQGYDPELKNEYVVIGAHIDHLGINKVTVDGKEVVQIYSGADDNASGVAALIEIAKQVQQNSFMFRRSIIFAFFGAEEVGMAGSWYFLNRSFSEVDKIVMMINLDMIGRSSGGNGFKVFTGVYNLELNTIVAQLSQRPLSLQPELVTTDYFPSDHRMFHEKGIPIALFTTGVHRDYHTPRDIPAALDYTQMEKISEFAYALAQHVANMDDRVSKGLKGEQASAATGDAGYYTQHDVDKRATFLHGDERQFLEKWVYPYIKYPDSAIRAGESGRVFVEFIIEKNGRVSDVVVTRGVNDELDAEVVKVVSASPKWKPAVLNGKNVRVKTSVAVDFKLSKNAEFKLKK